MYRSTLRLIALTVVATVAFAAGPAQAQSFEEDSFVGEVFAGQLQPGPSFLDDETLFGFRAGFIPTSRIAIMGSLGYIEFDDSATDGVTTVAFDVESWLLDFSVNYIFRPEHKFSILAGGGIGGAFSEFDADVTLPGFAVSFRDFGEDSFTLNAGVEGVIHLSDRFYLKPAFRARWHEQREDDEVDTDATLAFGIKF